MGHSTPSHMGGQCIMSQQDGIPNLDGDEASLPATIKQNEEKVRNEFWPKLQKFLSRVPFAERAVASYYCAFDDDTPLRVKGVLLAALAYFILPTDAVPDLLPFLGFTDDAAVIALAIAKIRKHLKPEHREQAEAKLEEMKVSRLKDAEA